MQAALAIDPEKETERIVAAMTAALRAPLRRRGFVVAISGGIDSAVCAALAVKAVGKERVFGLLLPERESSERSLEDGQRVARSLGIRFRVQDITEALEALGCYATRDEAIRSVHADYGVGWKSKLAMAEGGLGAIHRLRLVVESPDGEKRSARLPLPAYLQVVAASNYKQRVRKSIEYFQADLLNYAVVGTPNRLEYQQGFFVKHGDGAADIKPIAHLFKTQVYRLADCLNIPKSVRDAEPTTDTYSMEQTQEEFFFDLPLLEMDIVLWALEHGIEAQAVAEELGRSVHDVELFFKEVERKRRAAEYLHEAPILVRDRPFD